MNEKRLPKREPFFVMSKHRANWIFHKFTFSSWLQQILILGDSSQRAGPVLVALRQQAGRAILYHIIFLIMSILYHGKKLRTPSFQCPAYARSAATEWQALVIKKVYNILELWKNKYRLVQKRGGIWCQRRSQKGRREGPLSIPRKTSGATGEKRSHPS